MTYVAIILFSVDLFHSLGSLHVKKYMHDGLPHGILELDVYQNHVLKPSFVSRTTPISLLFVVVDFYLQLSLVFTVNFQAKVMESCFIYHHGFLVFNSLDTYQLNRHHFDFFYLFLFDFRPHLNQHHSHQYHHFYFL